MTKLEAVNLILRALSEHTVSSVEIRHPSVTLALDKLEMARQEVLSDGWWFNNIRVTLNKDVNGKVSFPSGALAFVPDRYECITRGGYLYNTTTQTFVFTEDVPGLITYDLDWDDLPNPAQRMVAYQAAIAAYSEDVGGQAPQSITVGYSLAQQQLQSGHIRQRRFNARSRPAWWRYENARRG
jgi:hypothetical protein